jgi:imidazolonepropionase-like amidohydrolase
MRFRYGRCCHENQNRDFVHRTSPSIHRGKAQANDDNKSQNSLRGKRADSESAEISADCNRSGRALGSAAPIRDTFFKSRKMRKLAYCAAIAALVAIAWAQQESRSGPVVYEGARLITGDGTPPIETGTFLVRNGHIAAIGRQGAFRIPAAATRVTLVGKTVMPAMINVHVHIGYEGYTSWGAQNYTPANVLDHLQREAYYGTAVTLSVGSSPLEPSLQFQRDQQAGKFPPASRFFFVPGYAPPNGGPDEVLRVATSALHVINEVSTAQEARTSIRKMHDQGRKGVKIWVDDRRGTYPKMTPEVYEAIIDEAHKHRMIVHAHATTLADQKAVVKAGADVLVHMVQNEKLDDEYLALLREKKPYWATVIGLGDPTAVCDKDPFFELALPDAVIAKIRANTERRPLTANCAPPAPNLAAREAILAYNFPRMIASGARIVLGTDTGVEPGHTFGSGEHVELARWVQLGLTPAQAIVGATQRPAELMGLTDMGTLAVGKRADFIVLDANPLDDIRNTRRISDVYLDGVRFDRNALPARWKNSSASQ